MNLNQIPITRPGNKQITNNEDSYRIEKFNDHSAAEEENRLIYALSKPKQDSYSIH